VTKSLSLPYVLFLADAAVPVFAPRLAAAQDRNGAVFVMTNAASNNRINAYTAFVAISGLRLLIGAGALAAAQRDSISSLRCMSPPFASPWKSSLSAAPS
jgi:hypothetical protein